MSIGCYLPRKESSDQYKTGGDWIYIADKGKALVGIEEQGNLPKTLSITQLYPNIAKSRVRVEYGIPEKEEVNLSVYNSLGALVKTLYQGKPKPGYYSLSWNLYDNSGKALSSGIYWIVLSQKEKRITRKLLVVR